MCDVRLAWLVVSIANWIGDTITVQQRQQVPVVRGCVPVCVGAVVAYGFWRHVQRGSVQHVCWWRLHMSGRIQ